MSPLMGTIIALVTSLNVLGCAWLIWWTARQRPGEAPVGAVKSHVWDGDLKERNNSMPRWWLILFFITIVFDFVYFALYPALGSFGNVLGWSGAKQYQQSVEHAQQQYAPVYAAFAGKSVLELSHDPKALALGHSLFANNCTMCHGSDGRGGPGFPNLADNNWLYGGTPEDIAQSIANGRQGVMPPLGAALGPQGVGEVVDYVLSLNGRNVQPAQAEAGKARFVLCATCHGENAQGNPAIGAPNLTVGIFQYGGTHGELEQTVTYGRHGVMPAHAWMGQTKVDLLAAYVYSLSHGQ